MLGQDAGEEGAIGTTYVNDPAMPVPVVVHHRHMQACSRTGISMHARSIARVEQCPMPIISDLVLLAPSVVRHRHMQACNITCNLHGQPCS